jgi:hypothetical protein
LLEKAVMRNGFRSPCVDPRDGCEDV